VSVRKRITQTFLSRDDDEQLDQREAGRLSKQIRCLRGRICFHVNFDVNVAQAAKNVFVRLAAFSLVIPGGRNVKRASFA